MPVITTRRRPSTFNAPAITAPVASSVFASQGSTPCSASAVAIAVTRAKPEVIVHELTAIPAAFDLRKFAEQFKQTNRLRREGTDHLLAAAKLVGARRFVAQSYAGWTYARTGGPVKTEDDPLDPNPPAAFRETCR